MFGISIIGPGGCLPLGIAVERTESKLSDIAQPSLMMRKSALIPLRLWRRDGSDDGPGYCVRVVLGE